MMTNRGLPLILILLSILAPTSRALSLPSTPVIQKRHVPGIWEVTLHQEAGSCDVLCTTTKDNTILLRLCENGSFQQFDDGGYQEGRWVKGRWEMMQEQEDDANNPNSEKKRVPLLYLAVDRQYFGPPHDVLLSAKLLPVKEENSNNDDDNNNNSRIVIAGEVFTGKFCKPKADPTFFDWDVQNMMPSFKTLAGTFEIQQRMSFVTLQGNNNNSMKNENSDSQSSPSLDDPSSDQEENVFE